MSSRRVTRSQTQRQGALNSAQKEVMKTLEEREKRGSSTTKKSQSQLSNKLNANLTPAQQKVIESIAKKRGIQLDNSPKDAARGSSVDKKKPRISKTQKDVDMETIKQRKQEPNATASRSRSNNKLTPGQRVIFDKITEKVQSRNSARTVNASKPRKTPSAPSIFKMPFKKLNFDTETSEDSDEAFLSSDDSFDRIKRKKQVKNYKKKVEKKPLEYRSINKRRDSSLIHLQNYLMNDILQPNIELSDDAVDLSLRLLEDQFSSGIGGFIPPSAIYSTENHSFGLLYTTHRFIQIINLRQARHWITLTNIGVDDTSDYHQIRVFDSSFNVDNYNDKHFLWQLTKLLFFGKKYPVQLIVESVQQQLKGSTCGLFAIAFAYDLCIGNNPSQQVYSEFVLRRHLHDCILNQFITEFPKIDRKICRRNISYEINFN